MISTLIKTRRRHLGLTQTELAMQSELSLPTIQNIEAARANPSWEVLSRLGNVLGLEATLQNRKPDWPLLARAGVPISEETEEINEMPIQLQDVVRELILATEQLGRETGSDHERDKEAIQSYLLALKLHFPRRFEKAVSSIETLVKWMPKEISGRHIKLARIAKARIAQYL